MQVCGVDEAGRGSVLGPLVVAGISIEKSKIRKLKSIGVKDSKKLSAARRKILYDEIIEIVDDYEIIPIYPRSIDPIVRRHKLNALEAKYMGRIIDRLKPNISYVDSCDVKPARFANTISQYVHNIPVKSYHHADSRFHVVSAASILAKVTRDKFIYKLNRYYTLGSGYPSDPITIRFLSIYVKKYKTLPSFTRKSWKPVQALLKKHHLLNIATTIK
ncbi:MAG: ribonuclease HII [Candidatus Nitrosoabyssus spongiisocia]|nr:MAG: ribonuclease HII [Nitrosopumilaceae archaeon AB1(1)]